ncbi:glycolate oxidase FAD binding subunit [Nitrosovibrio sp. Nv17]|nr:glycolate oxidase FAD binding subunit [Nitrosovibrio sp. Nv17]
MGQVQHLIDEFRDVLRTAANGGAPLRIRGGGSKDFYGNRIPGVDAHMLEAGGHAGIVEYEPTELVVTARAGTRLADLSVELRACGQMMAFEPPHFGPSATLGGCVATGLSGPRRASAGAVRDFVLGVRMLDGRGNDLRFGGRVMKNVAGYDISRLMVGSMGTLGLLLEVSLKVLPLPPAETTLCWEMQEAEAIGRMNQWAGRPLPVSATCFWDGVLTLRLSGAESAVRAARTKLGGDEIAAGAAFWESIREQKHAFFRGGGTLWRLSVKPTLPPLSLPGPQLLEWGGALRWWRDGGGKTGSDALGVRAIAAAAGGHATRFRGTGAHADAFHPLEPAMMDIHRRLKQRFDPAGILNPGRLYPQF